MSIFSPHHHVTTVILASTLGVSVAALQGCDPVKEQCGLVCSEKGFVGGDANISGIASIDAFFGAAIDLDASMRGLNASMRAELDAIGASVGLAPGATGAEINTAIENYLSGRVDGGLTIDVQPARCEANLEASVSAAAECDAEVDPGEVSAKCQGSCEIEASAMASCTGDATLTCTGTAPQLDCGTGTCTGSCAAEVTADLDCEGTCRGSCTANNSTMDGFEGKCAGECTGECVVEMSAGATCTGKCEGSCEYTPGEAGCEAGAEVHCEANGEAAVECSGTCEGKAEPPEVSAECKASVDAKASASIECKPPSVDIGFRFSGALVDDLDAQADFRAWLEGFRAHFSALVALRAKAEIVVDAAGNLSAAATGAVGDAVADLAANGDIAAVFGATCAIDELPVAAEALGASSTSLAGNVSASAEVIGAFAG